MIVRLGLVNLARGRCAVGGSELDTLKAVHGGTVLAHGAASRSARTTATGGVGSSRARVRGPRFHGGGYDLARRKHFALLLGTKMRHLCTGRNGSKKRYHVRVDRLPSRYAKADEAAERILKNTPQERNRTSRRGHAVHPRLEDHGRIALADVLLGAVMDDWCGSSSSPAKQKVKRAIAEHLGWRDLAADTKPFDWKFNIWNFYDPTSGEEREVETRRVNLRYPMKLVARR